MARLPIIVLLALSLLLVLGCARPAPHGVVGSNPIWVIEEDPVALRRRLAARRAEALAERNARCEAERAMLTGRLEALAGGAPSLPPAVQAALMRVEPLVLVGLETSDWPQRWRHFLYLLVSWYPPGYGQGLGERAHLLVESTWHELLERDYVRTSAPAARDRLRRCREEGRPCEVCIASVRDEWASLRPGSQPLPVLLSRLNALLNSLPEVEVSDRVAFIRAWAPPYEVAIAALDALAARETTEVRRQALLLAARAAIEQRHLDVARTRLECVRTSAPRAAPDPAAELLLGILQLLSGNIADARRTLMQVSAAGTVPQATAEAASQLLATLPAEPR